MEIKTDKEKVFEVATQLVIKNLTPSVSHSRIENHSTHKLNQIVSAAVEAAELLVKKVNDKFPK